jgi:predicted nucleic acid-binding protein
MLVIDASAALYLLASADGIGPLAPLDLAAPALLWSEVTSVLNEMRWRGEISEDLASAAFARLLAAPIDRCADDRLYTEAREVARELGWARTYDAEYVSLARLLGARLLTRDERLRRGAGRLVTVVGPDEVVPPEPHARSEPPPSPG